MRPIALLLLLLPLLRLLLLGSELAPPAVLLAPNLHLTK